MTKLFSNLSWLDQDDINGLVSTVKDVRRGSLVSIARIGQWQFLFPVRPGMSYRWWQDAILQQSAQLIRIVAATVRLTRRLSATTSMPGSQDGERVQPKSRSAETSRRKSNTSLTIKVLCTSIRMHIMRINSALGGLIFPCSLSIWKRYHC